MGFIQFKTIAFFCSAILAAGVLFSVWPRRKQPCIRNFIFLLISIIIWSLAAGFEARATSLTESHFWSVISYFGILGNPLYFLFFALYYTGYEYLLTRQVRTALYAISIFFMIAVLTNEWHHLFWSHISSNLILGETVIHYQHGILYYFAILYLYFLLAMVSLVLFQAAVNSHHIYRRQAICLFLAIPLPWVSNLLYVLKIFPAIDKDLTPLFLSLTGLIFGYTIRHYQLLDLLPVMREKIFDNLHEGILVLDDLGRIIDINRPACAFLKINQHAVIGSKATDVLPAYQGFFSENNARLEMECDLGASCWVELQITPFNSAPNHTGGRLVIIHDITHRKELEKELESLAITDTLTGLYNRRYLENCLKSEFERSERYHTPLSLAICDVDSFKEINDLTGHASGDQVLIYMAQMLRQCTRGCDIVVRMGGDEFVIIFPKTELHEAWTALERLRLKIKEYDFGGAQQAVSISAGVTAWFEGDTATNAMQRADQYLYVAKKQGKDCVISDEQVNLLCDKDNTVQADLTNRPNELD